MATPSSFNFRKNTTRKAAFTLLETVLAIGVVSFAMVSMIGLIPSGLGTFRKAMNLTVETTIVQNVSSEILRTDYNNLGPATYYYNQEGCKVTSGNFGERIYTVTVNSPTDLNTELVEKTAGKTVPIMIENRAHPGEFSKYFIIVPRS